MYFQINRSFYSDLFCTQRRPEPSQVANCNTTEAEAAVVTA